MPSRRRHITRRRRRLWPVLVLAGVAVVVALGILALPFRHAPAHAEAAKADLQLAKEALVSGKNKQAKAAIASAREDADALQSSVQGLGGDVWSWVPVLGGPVNDVRHLGNALDDLTAAAEAGAEVWPEVAGPKAELVQSGSFDIPTLEKVAAEARSAMNRLDSAEAELDAVADNRLIIGDRLGAARDEARDQVTPLTERADKFGPLLDVLPDVVGANGPRTYLLAILNPAELLYSGGTPQTFTQLTYDEGKLRWENTIDARTAPWLLDELPRDGTTGSPLVDGPTNVLTSAVSPDWPASGGDLMDAWTSGGQRQDVAGVFAIDLLTLADLLELSGPTPLTGIGMLTSDNLVDKLVGGYDEHLDLEARDAINRRLAKNVGLSLMSGEPDEVGGVFAAAARERRFAMNFADADEQGAFDNLGVTGRLAKPDRDYLGVFTQQLTPTKSDYWQRRSVTSAVKLREDGSARVSLQVDIHNDSPAYVHTEPDPGTGNFTRWNHLSVLTLLPRGARLVGGAVDGAPLEGQDGEIGGRPFHEEPIELAPQATHTLTLQYDVPAAATRGPRGELRYGLSIDPQGMVIPQSTTVSVQFPQDYTVGVLPEGWHSTGPRGASYTADLSTSQSFEIAGR